VTVLDAPGLISALEDERIRYRVIDHAAGSDTLAASAERGHDPRAAAKSLVLRVKGAVTDQHVVVTVPGHCTVDLDAVSATVGAERALLADPATAEALTGCVIGTIMPFGNDQLEAIADPSLLWNVEIYFNAADHCRSIAMRADDYVVLARPRLAPVAHDPDGPD
jgi:Ala-tRNA(Pro) deacylase